MTKDEAIKEAVLRGYATKDEAKWFFSKHLKKAVYNEDDLLELYRYDQKNYDTNQYGWFAHVTPEDRAVSGRKTNVGYKSSVDEIENEYGFWYGMR